MIKKYVSFFASVFLVATASAQDLEFTPMENVVFYDGYAQTSTQPTPPGIIRLDNSRFARKLSATEIANFQNTLSLEVTINALCDNYDRQGGVFFAIVPAGEEITSENKKTIEIGRFITPFMNKNVQPNEVSYQYELDHLIGMFKNQTFLQANDIWVEFFLFGVPYAAQTQISGCSGRTDVFQGTITFTSTTDSTVDQEYLPKAMWSRLRMNKTNDSDTPGTAARLFMFSNDENLVDAKIQLITSAHGAGTNGEEYVRRDHFVYFDDVQILTYKPGGLSCEPFRSLNTQANGIYGNTVKTASWWASWNNWCPGDKIPNRQISLGNVTSGQHVFKVAVPSGQFPNDNDEIVLSAFIYSKDNATLPNNTVQFIDYQVFPNPTSDVIQVNSSVEVTKTIVFDITGKQVKTVRHSTIDITELPSGMYILELEFLNGIKTTEKIIKK